MSKYDKRIVDVNYGAIVKELEEANRLKKIEILWAGRAGNMTDANLKKLLDILKDPDNDNLDLYGDYEE